MIECNVNCIGKVVFLAPTKPLVCQQIKACYQIMGLPEDETAYLEGSVNATRRELLWAQRRVFFSTPQTLHNDLSTGVVDARSIVCVVVDEAHRATSNYSYTTVIHELSKASNRFRVLALSATPGSDIRKIQNVSMLFVHHHHRCESCYPWHHKLHYIALRIGQHYNTYRSFRTCTSLTSRCGRRAILTSLRISTSDASM